MADLIATPTYVNAIRQLEPTDPAHPNTWNPNYQALLNNTAFLKQLAEAISTTLTNHTNNKSNPHGVTADQIGAALKAHIHDANDLPKASTSGQGIVQLTDSVSSTSTTLAATASAIKTVMDRANEAFTQAGDGKSSIATAVTAKGVSASPADTFATLAEKIGQISTGAKFASGNLGNAVLGPFLQNTVYSIVTGLDFTPDIVIIINGEGPYIYRTVNMRLSVILDANLEDFAGSNLSGYIGSNGGGPSSIFSVSGSDYLTDGFVLRCSTGNLSSYDIRNVNWFAVGGL